MYIQDKKSCVNNYLYNIYTCMKNNVYLTQIKEKVSPTKASQSSTNKSCIFFSDISDCWSSL